MLAQIAGVKAGVAKNIIPRPITMHPASHWTIDALDYVYNDWGLVKFGGSNTFDKAVLSMSFGYPSNSPVNSPGAVEKVVSAFLTRLSTIGVVLVCGAGNDGLVSEFL